MAKSSVFYSIESEKAVLGAMIASKKFCYEALNLLSESDFYDKNVNAVIFRAIKNIFDLGKEIDNTAVTNELQTNMKLLEQIGGVDYLYELQEYYVGDKNAAYHSNTIYELSLVRKLFKKTHDLEKKFSEEEITDVTSFIEEFGNAITKITQTRAAGDFQDSVDVVKRIKTKLEKLRKEEVKKVVTGVDTGFSLLNRYTNGWQNGNLIILAARPSVGKTAFAINLLYNAAIKARKTVAFFSLEMSADDICRRLLAATSSVSASNIKIGNLNDQDWLAIEEAQSQLARAKILIDDTSGIKLGEIRNKCTKLKAKDPNLGLIVIDYLGLITLSNPAKDLRQTIDEISRSLKGLARDLDVPVICLSQVSRANEKEKRKPQLSDLRDSGSIEQDADIVMFIHRDNYQKGDDENENRDSNDPFGNTEVTEILIKKNRAGEIGTVRLHFLKNIGKFIEFDDSQSRG